MGPLPIYIKNRKLKLALRQPARAASQKQAEAAQLPGRRLRQNAQNGSSNFVQLAYCNLSGPMVYLVQKLRKESTTMKNEAIHNYLITSYNRLAYTHSYIFGYAVKGMVYGARVMDGASLLPYLTCLSTASSKNGGTVALKYRPNLKQIALIAENAVEIKAVCTEQYLEEQFRTTKWNRGQIFEELAAKTFGGYQVDKKTTKFTESGDIVVDNIHYQVKYTKATFTDEKTLKNLGA